MLAVLELNLEYSCKYSAILYFFRSAGNNFPAPAVLRIRKLYMWHVELNPKSKMYTSSEVGNHFPTYSNSWIAELMHKSICNRLQNTHSCCKKFKYSAAHLNWRVKESRTASSIISLRHTYRTPTKGPGSQVPGNISPRLQSRASTVSFTVKKNES